MKNLFFTLIAVILFFQVILGDDVDVNLSAADSTCGFSVFDNNNITLFRVRGDGNVGIGTTSPIAGLHIAKVLDSGFKAAIYTSLSAKSGYTSSESCAGVYSNVDLTNFNIIGENKGVAGFYGTVSGTASFHNAAGFFESVVSGTGDEETEGIHILVNGNIGSCNGIKGDVSGGINENIGSVFYVGDDSYNASVTNYGVRAEANNGGINYCGYFHTDSNSIENYGIYASAENGSQNYAGYFGAGTVYIRDRLGIGIMPVRSLHISDVMRLEPLFSVPSNPQEGDIYMDGSDHKLKVYDGTVWKSCW